MRLKFFKWSFILEQGVVLKSSTSETRSNFDFYNHFVDYGIFSIPTQYTKSISCAFLRKYRAYSTGRFIALASEKEERKKQL